MKIRNLVFCLGTIVLLAAVNAMILQKEDLAANGQTALLELGAVDPRSLMQGDYLQLRYKISTAAVIDTTASDGLMVVELDDHNVAHFARLYDPHTPLAPHEIRLGYRQRSSDVYIGPESFFFQEGQASYFRGARYAELRVSPSGEVLLIGLRDANFELLGPPKTD